MAKTAKTTGPMLKAFYAWSVDTDGTPKTFKSKNSLGVDNTAAVQADESVSGTLGIYDLTWNNGSASGTQTLRTRGSVSGSYWQFGTNKPFVPASNTFTNGVLCIFIGQYSTGESMRIKSVGGNRLPRLGAYLTLPTWWADSEYLSTTAATVANAALVTSAVKYKGSASASALAYLALDTDAMAVDALATYSAAAAEIGNDSIDRLLADGLGQFAGAGMGHYILIADDYASDAARLTDLQAIHNDPEGALYDTAGPSQPWAIESPGSPSSVATLAFGGHVGLSATLGIVTPSKYWTVPTDAANGTVRRMVVLADDNATIIDHGSVTASAGVFALLAANQALTIPNIHRVAFDNWDGNTASVSIYGGSALASLLQP